MLKTDPKEVAAVLNDMFSDHEDQRREFLSRLGAMKIATPWQPWNRPPQEISGMMLDKFEDRTAIDGYPLITIHRERPVDSLDQPGAWYFEFTNLIPENDQKIISHGMSNGATTSLNYFVAFASKVLATHIIDQHLRKLGWLLLEREHITFEGSESVTNGD